ncbi:MAG: hypothetical protein Q8P30_00005, partial [Candidatus Uhrbacteria bacterium]|nr:hypothetical protein [Candidatus Uhrbacteria bacterium]
SRMIGRIDDSIQASESRMIGRIDDSIQASESRMIGRIDESIQASESRMIGRIDDSESRMIGRIDESIQASESRMIGRIDDSESRIMGFSAEFIETNIIPQFNQIRAVMVTKDYLDEKLANFRESLEDSGLKVGQKLNRLVDKLYRKDLLTVDEVGEVHGVI